jgi:hypothetical protein
MKKQILASVVSLLLTTMATAQNDVARIKYEEAEVAYAKEDYVEALSKVKEAEKILKVANPKTQYLKIVTQYKLTGTDFAVLRELRQNCDMYLKNFDGRKGIEDKYREVYSISESLKKYPANEEAFKIWADELQQQKHVAELAAKEKEADAALTNKMALWDPAIDGVRIGMKFSTIPASAGKEVDFSEGISMKKGKTENISRDCIMFIPKFKYGKMKSSTGLIGITVDAAEQQVVSVTKNHQVGGKADIERSRSVYNALVDKMKAQFGPENVIENEAEKEISKKSSYFTKTATLKNNKLYEYSLVHQVYKMGGLLGTECSVSESISVPGLWQAQ